MSDRSTCAGWLCAASQAVAAGMSDHHCRSSRSCACSTMTYWSTGHRSPSGEIEIAPFSVKGTDALHCTSSWQTKVSFRLRSSTGSAGGHQFLAAIPKLVRCPGWKHRPERLVTDYRSALDVRSLCAIRSEAVGCSLLWAMAKSTRDRCGRLRYPPTSID